MKPFDTLRLLRNQRRLIELQDELIDQQREQLRTIRLEHARDMQGIVSSWLINLEQPELDLRHDLAELERSLGATIAICEEYVV